MLKQWFGIFDVVLKENIFTRDLLNHILREMSLFTFNNWFVSYSLDYLKSLLESKNRFPILEFSGSHCMKSLKNDVCQCEYLSDVYSRF